MIKSKLILHVLFFILFFIGTNVFAKEQYLVKIERVVDGDTFIIKWDTIPFGMDKVSVRIKGIDTPETHSKCLKEKSSGLDAKVFLTHLIDQQNVIISNCSPDKFARWDCDVTYKDQDIAATMINNGFAKPYHGEKKTPWCTK